MESIIECGLDRTLFPVNTQLRDDALALRTLIGSDLNLTNGGFEFEGFEYEVSRRLGIPMERLHEAAWALIDDGELYIAHDFAVFGRRNAPR